MPQNFPESDWKTLSRLKSLALDRLCQRILHGAKQIITRAKDGKYHDAYLALYRYVHKEDQIVGNCFNDWRRSQALYLLVNWRSENLLTEEEFAEFSAETRNTVMWFLQNR